MKTALHSLFGLFDSQAREREIEEEMDFHLELMTREFMRQDFASAEARRLALERFGDVAKVRRECIEIRRRNGALVRALKSILILMFLIGISLRVFSSEITVMHMGDLLAVIAVMGRLFIYVRAIRPPGSPLKHTPPTLLSLTRGPRPSRLDQNEKPLTPVERIIFDK
jgi:hypothetical protein